ncbi:MAG: Nif3-like dinuclear metal center hexameric protein [Candidatus Gracilibacteria bacterium]|nr:Nif3-like dinuclear metal center hexameric protein [Candidatus Gracilibacteria bacterium]
MKKEELIKYLDEYLKISEFKDDSKNGLQVDNSKDEIKKIGYAVDANTYIFDKAIEEGVDMVLTHHGLFWGFEQALVGVPFERAKKLINNDISLYSCHLPLDAHNEVGNNIGLAKAFINIFGLQEGEYEIEDFGFYHGIPIGFGIKFKHKIHISNMVTPYAEMMQLTKRLYNFGKKDYINSVAFVSGGALSCVKEANDKNYDVFVTGEGAHYEMTFAKELGQSILIGGHYETEKIGPKLLAYHLRDKFGIEIVFLDEKY